MKSVATSILFASMLVAGAACAQEPATPDTAPQDAAHAGPDPAELLGQLKPRTGTIALPGGVASLDVARDFLYLDPNDTQKLLEQGWGNPPGSGGGTLGMLLPADVSPFSEGGWGVVVTYVDDGHVSDSDADEIDYTDLLKDMQKSAEQESKAREKQGYDPMQLIGWAEPPHYDKGEHKIYWAKDLAIGKGDVHSLNYFVRVLGREGVLELNAVAGMSQLDQVRTDMKKVVGMASFTQGNRYADFNSSTDKVAAYGLAALVAGGIAAKTGLIAKLVALLIAGKKLIAVGLFALAGLLGKLFKRNKDA